MCDNADPNNAVQDTTEPRARVEHECCACGETIRVGDRYKRTGQCNDGHWSTYIHCLRCWAMCDALFTTGVECVAWELDCGEAWVNPPENVARLAFLTREEMQAEAELAKRAT